MTRFTHFAVLVLALVLFAGSAEVLQAAEVHGTVWNDINGDGVFDANETTVAGIDIFVDHNGNNLPDANDTWAVTDANGDYFFVDLLGHKTQDIVQKALDEVRQHCLQLSVLGSFPINTTLL